MQNEGLSNKSYQDLLDDNQKLSSENASLWHHIKLLKKSIYGQKSEQLKYIDPNQCSLFAEHTIDIPEVETEVKSHNRKRGGRKALPENLPRERYEYEPEETTCSCCGEELEKIGEDITEELDYKPAKLVVKEHVKIKKACKKCNKNGIKTGQLPANIAPIKQCRASLSLLTFIIVSKYCDSLPLNRLEQIFKRQGYALPRQRMCDWIQLVASMLKPIYDKILEEIKTYDYLQADETTIKVQDPKLKGKLRTGYFWAILSPPNIIYYHYASSRASEVPKTLLSDFQGTLQTDAYAGYNEVYAPETCSRLACLAHIRRKLVDAHAANNADGNKALKLIVKLYKIEKELKSKRSECLNDEDYLQAVYSKRQKKSKEILTDLYLLLENISNSYLPKNILRGAAEYALKQKDAMFLYLEDPRYEIDNNAIERMMRPIAVGRKNYLFAGSDEGARAAGIFYTLINTCKLNDINPVDYLNDVITRVNEKDTVDLDSLVPHKWQPLT